MVKVSSLIRMIGRALYVLSVFLIVFFIFSAHRGVGFLSLVFYVNTFFMSLILAGAGAFAMLISKKMVVKDQRRE